MEDLAVHSQSNGFHVQEMPALIVFMEAADDVDQKEVRTYVRTSILIWLFHDVRVDTCTKQRQGKRGMVVRCAVCGCARITT